MKHSDNTDFEQLFRQYYSTLCGIARGYVRDIVIAEELVGDVFVRYWNNRPHTIIRTSLKDYLFTSVKNACIDYMRTERKRRRKLSYIDDDHNIVCATLADLGENPLDYLISVETEQRIINAIDELPERYRQTFVLCRLDEMSYDEAAQAMGISRNTIKSNLREALALLYKKLGNIKLILFILYRSLSSNIPLPLGK
ncbi:MAG: RNA polymerase sigma-70 factor [Bacteroidales bacterium]|nr:RNA polymerase sigma-70 factor [Bacteroidales bacterium]